MAAQYLSRGRFWLEIVLSAFGMWFGGGVYFVLALGIGEPLWWTGLPVDSQVLISGSIMVGALLSAIGTRVNGSWTYSPLLRAAGLGFHALASWVITFSIAGAPDPVHGIPSGFFTYSGLAVILTWVAYLAALDVIKMKRLRHG